MQKFNYNDISVTLHCNKFVVIPNWGVKCTVPLTPHGVSSLITSQRVHQHNKLIGCHVNTLVGVQVTPNLVSNFLMGKAKSSEEVGNSCVLPILILSRELYTIPAINMI